MTFSVIIPTLGRPEVLKSTLESVVACSPQPLEVLVVDGDAARSASRVVEEFGGAPAKVAYVRSPPGLTRQRNEGMRNAAGDVVVFFDDDVIVAADVFEELERVYSDSTVIGATGRVVESKSKRIVGKHSKIRSLLPGGGREGAFTRYGYPRRIVNVDEERDTELMHGSFMSARADVAREIGFDEDLPGYALAEDEDFSFRLSRRGRIRYAPSAVIEHLKIGHGSRDARAFGRQLVVNRAYLFRKNFRPTLMARAQFCMLVGLLIAHRAVNGEWQELRGLIDGSREALKARARLMRPPREGPVRVLFLSSHSRRGGSERYLESVVARLGDGWVEQIVCLEEGPLVTSLRRNGIPVHVLQTSRSGGSIIASARRFRLLVQQSRADVIHANGVKAAVVAAIASLRSRVPIVWIKHDFSYDGLPARVIASQCRFVVGVSKAVTDTFGKATERIRVVHTGIEVSPIDRDMAHRALIDEMGVDSGSRVLGLVGRLHPVKGHATVLDILPELINRIPLIEVAFVGAEDDAYPGYENELKLRADELGVGHRVHWLGYRDDLRGLFGGIDILVVPSGPHRRGPGREAFPLVALESMAAGTPVVGFDRGGFPEVIGDCGLAVSYQDTRQLVESIVRVLTDQALADRLAACGRERVEKYFTFDPMLRALRSIYADAAA
jgi:glycosyltransferase involved in cell wall biosynthesis/GT2 family glycosyltransferase